MGTALMSFESIMRGPLEKVYGAIGWAFLADDGEIVYQESHPGIENLQLLAAYHGITAGNYRRFGLREALGEIRTVICGYDQATCILKLFPEGYFLIFVLTKESNIGQALNMLDGLMPGLIAEIAM
jgi:hypothetical protein